VKNQKTQTGFAHLIVITVILAIGLVGAIGYVVYQNMNPKQTDSADNSSQDQDKVSDKTPGTDADTDADPISNDDYLVLSDWGVKFKMPDDTVNRTIKYYKVSNNGAEYYRFTTSGVEEIDGCASTSLGTINRSTKTPSEAPNDPSVTNGMFLKKIENYNYYFSPALAVCATDQSEAHGEIQAADGTLIKELIDSIVQD
jgi:hypothetical protein